MTDEQIQKIIDALLKSTFLDDWYFYVILFSASLLGGLIGAYIKSYGAEKAKYSAIESSLDTIKKQVAATTATSEKIKIALEHDNWRQKELEVLKRSKLEEYFSLASVLIDHFDAEIQNTYLGKNIDFDAHILKKLELIQALYLPELFNEHIEIHKVVHLHLEAFTTASILRTKQIDSGIEPFTPDEHINHHQDILDKLVRPIRIAQLKIKEVAMKLNQ